jgi:hypothetical protein
MLVYNDRERVRLVSLNGRDHTRRFRDLASATWFAAWRDRAGIFSSPSECAVFVTCDEATILRYRAQVEAEFPIRLVLPSELVREIQTATGAAVHQDP